MPLPNYSPNGIYPSYPYRLQAPRGRVELYVRFTTQEWVNVRSKVTSGFLIESSGRTEGKGGVMARGPKKTFADSEQWRRHLDRHGDDIASIALAVMDTLKAAGVAHCVKHVDIDKTQHCAIAFRFCCCNAVPDDADVFAAALKDGEDTDMKT